MSDRQVPEDPNRDERIIEQLAIHLHNVWRQGMGTYPSHLSEHSSQTIATWKKVAEAALQDVQHALKPG
jgi:hypothetical protein